MNFLGNICKYFERIHCSIHKLSSYGEFNWNRNKKFFQNNSPCDEISKPYFIRDNSDGDDKNPL